MAFCWSEMVQILPGMYRGLAPDSCTLVKAHTLVKGTLNLLLVNSDQDKTGLVSVLQSHNMLSSVNSCNKQHCFSGWFFFSLLFIFYFAGTPHTEVQ